MLKKPKNFALIKVKIVKNGGLDVTYRETTTEKGITDTIDLNIKNTQNPSPDLVNKIAELKEYLAKAYHIDAFVVLAKSKGLEAADKKAFKSVLKLIENVHAENMKRIEITGVAISGSIEDDKDKRSVIITGTQLMENNAKTALNSPRIKLNTDQFKFEADVQEIINALSDEVAEYLFEGKRAQLDLFLNDDKKLDQDFVDGNISKLDDEGNVIEKKPKKGEKLEKVA